MLSREDLEGLSPEFIAWLEETEVYSTRFERLAETFPLSGVYTKMLIDWLYAAYLLGRKTQ